ncbi:aromatase/cyclase [Streptomyces xanthophaeus]|uniref:aromatase/cyclase n=1 Tax=Streptomyces xanthophaeus TaxID=67385 RepID=UPI0026476865|nr:aromatase/cyclase [Streptomyces xanthophaeus]WKD32276.1 aromatase/cyclase [Streptomyces xanthophaeus]
MSDSAVHRTRHSTEVAASAETVYQLVARAEDWPHIFPPSVHVERLEGDGRQERLKIWAFANGEVRSWTSRRELAPERARVSFRQEVSSHPVEAMGGEWIVEPAGEGRSTVTLLHDFRVAGDDAEALAWVLRAVDTNSDAELAALKQAAETFAAEPGVLLAFEDAVEIEGSQEDVHEFLLRADLWEERLPHVSRLVLTEPGPDLQTVEMDTAAPDGSVHTTRSVRVSFAPDRLVYKQTEVPALMAAHTGRWTLTPTATGVRAASWHTVVLRPERVREVLGPEATLEDARRLVRGSLGRNSTATLLLAKAHAEGAVTAS